jgi:hypothetical protein
MADDPYQPPGSTVADPAPQIAVPDSVYRDIRNAWILAVISGVFTLALKLPVVLSSPATGSSALALLDVAVIFGLAYGIYRKSRACAVILLIDFIYSKINLLQAGAALASMAMAVVFVYFYIRGALGTFRYQKAARSR